MNTCEQNQTTGRDKTSEFFREFLEVIIVSKALVVSIVRGINQENRKLVSSVYRLKNGSIRPRFL